MRFDLENTPLEIQTGVLKSGKKISIKFQDADDEPAGGFVIGFKNSPAQYRLYDCTHQNIWNNFNKDITSKVKVWRFTKTTTFDETRVRIHYNDVQLVEVVLSSSVCAGGSDWTERWARDITQIVINHPIDTASDYYRPYKLRPGDRLIFIKGRIS